MFQRTAILIAVAAFLPGCACSSLEFYQALARLSSDGPKLTLLFQQDSSNKLPDNVKVLAIADFTEAINLEGSRPLTFKDVARDKFQMQFAKVDKQHRFDLVDRPTTDGFPIDLGPFPDPERVVKLPRVKTIAADALVIGKLDVESSTRRVHRPGVRILSLVGQDRAGEWVEVRHTAVSLTVQVINLETHRYCIYSVTRSHGDEADSGGGGEDVASDSKTIIRQLLGDCVAEVVRQMLHPEQGIATVTLRETGSPNGISDLAIAGNYAEALEKYKIALAQERAKGIYASSATCEAALAWDAGVMCEALAGAARTPAEAETYLESAKSYYFHALNKNKQADYRNGLDRVRDRLDSAETLQRYTTSTPAKRGD